MERLAAILEENWFDTLASLRDLSARCAQELGVPDELARLLRQAAAMESEEPEQAPVSFLHSPSGQCWCWCWLGFRASSCM